MDRAIINIANSQLIRGEFDVIKELLATEPSAAEGKKKIDHVIDVCGPAPKGNGLQNLRECIIETKWKYDVAPEEKQVRTENPAHLCNILTFTGVVLILCFRLFGSK